MVKKQKRKTTRSKIGVTTKLSDVKEIIIQSKKIEGIREQTLRNYRKFFKKFDECFGEVDLKELNESDARNFISFLMDTGIINSTINTYLNCAKCSFQILEKEEMCSNIFKDVKRLKTDEKAIEILTIEEIRALLKVFDKGKYNEFRDFVLIHTLLDSMGRIQETLTLKIENIDFIKQTITFQNTKGRRARIVPVYRKWIYL